MSTFGRRARQHAAAYTISAATLIGALAWSDVIKVFFAEYYPRKEFLMKIVYALFVTIISILFISQFDNGGGLNGAPAGKT